MSLLTLVASIGLIMLSFRRMIQGVLPARTFTSWTP